MELKKRYNGYYFAYYKEPGTKRFLKKTLRTKNKILALQNLKEFEESLNKPNIAPEKITLHQTITDYVEYITSAKYKATAVREISCLNNFKSYFPNPNIALDQITMSDIQKYQMARKGDIKIEIDNFKSGASPKTINEELLTIRRLLEDSVSKGYIIKNPTKGVKRLYYVPPEAEFFSKEQLNDIIKYSEYPYDLIFKFLSLTGLRISELLHLEFTDVMWDPGQIKIVNKNDWKTKTRRSRIIPLSSIGLNILSRFKDEAKDNYVVPIFYRRRNHLIEHLKKVLIRCGIPTKGRNLHTLRHTFGSNLAMAGVDIPSISKLMGHTKVDMTMRYAHLSPDYLNSAIDRLENFLFDSIPADENVIKFNAK